MLPLCFAIIVNSSRKSFFGIVLPFRMMMKKVFTKEFFRFSFVVVHLKGEKLPAISLCKSFIFKFPCIFLSVERDGRKMREWNNFSLKWGKKKSEEKLFLEIWRTKYSRCWIKFEARCLWDYKGCLLFLLTVKLDYVQIYFAIRFGKINIKLLGKTKLIGWFAWKM